MSINPVHFAHQICDEFLRYLFSAFPLSDPELAKQARSLLERREDGAGEFPNSQAILDHATIQLLWNWYRRDRDSRNRELLEHPSDPDAETETKSP